MVLESGFSTHGVVENGLIGAFSVFLFDRCCDRVEDEFRCRILEFFLYRSFVYLPIHVADVVEGFTWQTLLFPVRWNYESFR